MPTPVYLVGEDVVLDVPFVNSAGAAVTAASATYRVLNENDVEVVPETAATLAADGLSTTITISAASNSLAGGAVRGFRTVLVEALDVFGNTTLCVAEYFIETSATLSIGENTFANLGTFMMMSQDYSKLVGFANANYRARQRALVEAYYRIGMVPMTPTVLKVATSEEAVSTSDLNNTQINSLDSKVLAALLKAQLFEANAILTGTGNGNSAIETRRRQGIISQSHGEVTEFFRTDKPVDSFLSKDTIRALNSAGLIAHSLWVRKIGRA